MQIDPGEVKMVIMFLEILGINREPLGMLLHVQTVRIQVLCKVFKISNIKVITFCIRVHYQKAELIECEGG